MGGQFGLRCIGPLYSLVHYCLVELSLLPRTCVCRRAHEICPLHVFRPSVLFILAAFSKTCMFALFRMINESNRLQTPSLLP